MCITLAGLPPIILDAAAIPRADDDDVDGLLGRDALASLTLTYRGGFGTFTLE